MESMTRGGTRWKRFALVMVPSVAATAAIGVSLAQGALAASFAVSGQEFKVTAGYLDGHGFAQYGGVDMGYKDLKGDEKVAHPQVTFIPKAGLNTYRVPLTKFSQPAWVTDTRVDPRDIMKQLTSINVTAYCDECRPSKGMVIVDNVMFEK